MSLHQSLAGEAPPLVGHGTLRWLVCCMPGLPPCAASHGRASVQAVAIWEGMAL